MKSIFVAAVAAFALAMPAFAQGGGCLADQTFNAGDISVADAFSRATLPNAKSGGGFMTITNAGSTPDRLIGVTTDAAVRSEIHQMKMDGDMMKMGAVEGGLEIPAGGSVTLAPGGYHVMLMGLKQPLVADGCLDLTLTFETAGTLPVSLAIGPVDADAAPAHAGMKH